MSEEITAQDVQGIAEPAGIADAEITATQDTQGGKGDGTTSTEGQDAKTSTGITDKPDTKAGQADNKEPEKEVYEYELTANDGEDLDFFRNACKKHGLSKRQAEGMLADIRAQVKADLDRNTRDAEDSARAMFHGWQDEMRNDKEFGGKNMRRTYADCRKAFDTFDEDGDLQDLLRKTGFQHNPKVIRAIAKVGRSMREDRYIGSKGGEAEDMDLASRMYPGMVNKKAR